MSSVEAGISAPARSRRQAVMSAKKSVSRVVAIEEAFLHPSLWALFPESLRQRYDVVKTRLSDVGADRIRRMDAAGIDTQVLSHVQPGIQILPDADANLAIKISREVNDWLADVVRRYPARFAGFAMLPTQSPAHAADELQRTVSELGFRGALVNGHTNGRYLDDRRFDMLLDRAQSLDVPIYIHPTDPPPAICDVYYQPYATALVPSWGWPVETGTHLLRLICGGVFDRYPRLKIIVGHMGELLPYCYTRLNSGLTMADWLLSVQAGKAGRAGGYPGMKNSVGFYLRNNVFITSSGVFDQPVFDCAKAMLGLQNLLFSVDDPFQDNFAAMEFLNACDLSPQDKERFAHGTADRLLKLDGQSAPNAVGRRRIGDSWYAIRARLKSKVGRALISALVD